jgi:phosphoribosylamine--glycine ligase
VVSREVLRAVEERIVQPALRGLAAEGAPFRGCLYVGLMIQAGQPRVVEFNCRFGDPELQAVLPLLDGDLYSLLACAAGGDLSDVSLGQKPGAACCVVLTAGGYPGPYQKGKRIEGLSEAAALPDVNVFHAGTRRLPDGEAVTAGGRVLGVTGTGTSIKEAIAAAYRGASLIHFEGCHYRRDIGHRALGRG